MKITNDSQNISLGDLKTAGNQRGVKPQRLTRKQFRERWRKKFTELRIEDQERKRNQLI